MKTLLTLGVAALVATTSLLAAKAQSGDSTPSPLDGFAIGDARYAVEARFSLTTDDSGAQALVLDVVSTNLRLAPVFVEARKPMTANVTVDGAVVLQATDDKGVLRGTIPADTLQQWLGSEHDFELEVLDAGGEVLLYGGMEDATIGG